MQVDNPDLFPESVVSLPRLGWRLQRLEVCNWGTFNRKVFLMSPEGGWTLLVGENGSGKSTAVDALRTLLVPPRIVKDSYNDASGATKGKDRTRRSYILGAWASEGQEDSARGVTKYLRTEQDISTLLAVFSNARLKKSVTLAQLLWLSGTAVHDLFAISQGDRSIKDDMSDLGAGLVRDFKTKLEKRNFEVYKSFSGYAARFTGLMGIPSEEALQVFNQAIGVKDVAEVEYAGVCRQPNEPGALSGRPARLERTQTMSVLDTLRKGFGYLLMSMGVSSPARKAKPAPKPAPKPESGQ